MKKKFTRQKQLFSERPDYKSIGYAREITNKQISISEQVEELKNAGCDVVFHERVNSSQKERPQFDEALGKLEEGDDIISRSGNLYFLIEFLQSRIIITTFEKLNSIPSWEFAERKQIVL